MEIFFRKAVKYEIAKEFSIVRRSGGYPFPTLLLKSENDYKKQETDCNKQLKTKIALYVHSRVQLFLPFLEM
jgi:protein-disulfide isomerase-like protein with CxxC motif